MKIKLEFDMNNYESGEREEVYTYLNAPKYHHVLFEVDQFLRARCKYHDDSVCCFLREKLWQLMDEHNVTLE